MCDTVVIVAEGRVLFAKNSDRDANEPQVIEWHTRQTHASGARVRCTWIEIPQARETCATVISRPAWMWGAEMGANEHGVVIGNEAVFTNQPYASTGLTGMDLLRLALERADSAKQACGIIVGMLEQYGQGGGCGFEHRAFTYHNSFIVADRSSAFVLETAGRKWAVEAVHGARTISNGLTIPDFAEKYSDVVRTRVSACAARRARTQTLTRRCHGVRDLFALLRDHGEGEAFPRYALLNGGMHAPCMHAGGLLAAAQTTASWVSELTSSSARHWATGTAAPCTGLFKPLDVDQPLDLGEPGALWWRHEKFHRIVVRDPATLMPLFTPERDATEAAWDATPPEAQHAWNAGEEILDKWTAAVQAHAVHDTRPILVRRYWSRRAKAVSARI